MKRFVPRAGALVLVAVLVGVVVWLRPDPPQPPPVPRKDVVLQYADGTRLWGSRDGGPRPDLVRRLVAALDEMGMSLDRLELTGAVVRTTINVKAQTESAAVVGRLAAPERVDAAVTAVDPETGGVRAYLNLSRRADLAGGEPVELRPELTRPFAEAGRPDLVQPRMRLLDVTAAYATLAAGGVQHRTHFVASVTAADGSELYRSIPASDPALDQGAVARVTARLKAECDGIACVPDASGWMAGYTPRLAVGVFVDEAGGAVDTGRPKAIWQELLATLGG